VGNVKESEEVQVFAFDAFLQPSGLPATPAVALCIEPEGERDQPSRSSGGGGERGTVVA